MLFRRTAESVRRAADAVPDVATDAREALKSVRAAADRIPDPVMLALAFALGVVTYLAVSALIRRLDPDG